MSNQNQGVYETLISESQENNCHCRECRPQRHLPTIGTRAVKRLEKKLQRNAPFWLRLPDGPILYVDSYGWCWWGSSNDIPFPSKPNHHLRNIVEALKDDTPKVQTMRPANRVSRRNGGR